MKKIAVIEGPNLNMLGEREPEIYGSLTMDEIHRRLNREADGLGAELIFFQSNHEGEIIDFLQKEATSADGVIINPGAFTHYSYAIVDAVRTLSKPTVEVHISNIHKREEWRHNSVFSHEVDATISGLGVEGYISALRYLLAAPDKS